jgi:hypothetical protein
MHWGGRGLPQRRRFRQQSSPPAEHLIPKSTTDDDTSFSCRDHICQKSRFPTGAVFIHFTCTSMLTTAHVYMNEHLRRYDTKWYNSSSTEQPVALARFIRDWQFGKFANFNRFVPIIMMLPWSGHRWHQMVHAECH